MTRSVGGGNRHRFLTVGWNNGLAAVLGLAVLAYASIALSGSSPLGLWAFIWLVVLGAVY